MLDLFIYSLQHRGFIQEEESGPEAEFETELGAGSGVASSNQEEEDCLSVKSF